MENQESDEFVEKIKRFLEERQGLTPQEAYFVVSQLRHDYEQVVMRALLDGEDYEDEGDEDDDEADFEGLVGDQGEEDIVDDMPTPPKPTRKKTGSAIKKPKVKLE